MAGRSKYTDEEKLVIIKNALQLNADGVAWSEIARRLSVNRQTLRNWVEKFKKTAPIPLHQMGTVQLEDWEREEVKNLERVNKAFLKLLQKIEEALAQDQVDKELASSVKALTDSVVAIMRGLVEVNQMLSVRRKVERVSDGSRKLKELREAHLAQYGKTDGQKVG